MTDETNGLVEYGKKLETLGKLFQDPSTTLDQLVRGCFDLGLVLSFAVEPNHETSETINPTYP